MKAATHSTLHVLIKLALSAGVSGVILYVLISLISRELPEGEQLNLVQLLSTTFLPWVLGYLLLHLIGVVVRAVRYQLLLKAGKEPCLPTLPQLILVTGFRNMMVDLLPARIGELGYVALLNRAYGVRVASCLSSLTLSVVFSFAALVVLMIGLVVWQVMNNEVSTWTLWAALVAIVICFLGFLVLIYLLPGLVRYLQKLQTAAPSHGLSNRSLFSRLATVLKQMDEAIAATRQSGIIMHILGISLLIRILKYLGMLLLFMAVARSNFPQLLDASWLKVCIALVGAEVATSLPIPTLMGFGSFEVGGTLIFSIFDIPLQAGMFTLLGVHIWSQVVDYVFGALCLMMVFLLPSGLHSKNPNRQP